MTSCVVSQARRVKRAGRNKSALCVLCPKCVWGRMRDRVGRTVSAQCREMPSTWPKFQLEARRALLVMANAWLMLAAQRQRYIDTTPGNEPPPPVNEPPPPLDDALKPTPINDTPPAKERHC